jgi:hypothetical protein
LITQEADIGPVKEEDQEPELMEYTRDVELVSQITSLIVPEVSGSFTETNFIFFPDRVVVSSSGSIFIIFPITVTCKL